MIFEKTHVILMVWKKLYRNNRKILFSFLFISFFTAAAQGQDIHFSLFNASPLYLNPANTGNFNGDWRLAANYRNQWSALAKPFSTAAVGFDKQFYWLNQNFSFGVAFINDESGSLSLSVNKLYGSLGFTKNINHHIFHVGFQLGYVLKSLNYNKVTLPNQWDPYTGAFNNSLSTGEVNMGDRVSNLDLNLGLIWRKKIGIFEPEAGLAFSHLNNPNESFFDDTQRQQVRTTLHASVKTNLRDEIYIRPLLLFMNHKGANESMVGLMAGFNVFGHNSGVKELNAGLYLRNGFITQADAIAVSAGATFRRFDFALCYDYTVSVLKTTTNNLGAFEISLIYKSISTVLNSYSIPCERY
jgi:type IX secretion system PorP/SprF family membrane protein